MSPLFVNAEGQERNALADYRTELLDYAQCIEAFLDRNTQKLCFDEYLGLFELQVELATAGKMLHHGTCLHHIERMIDQASELFSHMRSQTVSE